MEAPRKMTAEDKRLEESRDRKERPQQGLEPSLQRRRDLHARQVGVPLVRRLGPGVPLCATGSGRCRIR